MARTKRRKKPCLSKRQGRHYTCTERLFGAKSQRIIPGHNESCSSQKPLLWDPVWLRCACTPQGSAQIYQGVTKEGDWPEGRQRPGELSPYKGFTLPKGMILSELARVPFCVYFSINFYFTLHLLPLRLNLFLTRQARLGALALTAGRCGLVVRIPGLGN